MTLLSGLVSNVSIIYEGRFFDSYLARNTKSKRIVIPRLAALTQDDRINIFIFSARVRLSAVPPSTNSK
jgi:hypothetical protein